MSWEAWLAFVAASVVILVLPGPTILLVVSHALSHGRSAAAATVAGVALGDLAAITASLAGLGVLLAASADLFAALRWVGAAYLVYLGVKLWRTPPVGGGVPEAADGAAWRLFGHAFAVTALNPKSIVFFVAFAPQFISRDAPYWPQAATIIATYVAMSVVNAGMFGLLGERARSLVGRPSVLRAVNRTGGGLLVGAGVATAAWR
jgi:threonine/homoserine/homoserine lactone efflux protein